MFILTFRSSHIHIPVHTDCYLHNTPCWAHSNTHTHTHNPSIFSTSLNPPGTTPFQPPVSHLLPVSHLQGGARQFGLISGVGVHAPSTALTPTWYLPHTHTHPFPSGSHHSPGHCPVSLHCPYSVTSSTPPKRTLSFIGQQDFPVTLSLPPSRVPEASVAGGPSSLGRRSIR